MFIPSSAFFALLAFMFGIITTLTASRIRFSKIDQSADSHDAADGARPSAACDKLSLYSTISDHATASAFTWPKTFRADWPNATAEGRSERSGGGLQGFATVRR